MKTFIQWLAEARKIIKSKRCECGEVFTPKGGYRFCPACVKAKKIVMQGDGYLQPNPRHSKPWRGPGGEEDVRATKSGLDDIGLR